MIGITGGYFYKFSVGDLEDFIVESELLEFTIIEESGYALPSFILHFKSFDDSILAVLNESNTINVSYGKDLDGEMSLSRLRPLKTELVSSGSGGTSVLVSGVYDAMDFVSNPHLFISDEKSGIAVMEEVASKYFTVENTLGSSVDSMKWIQHNISDRFFVCDLWLHSYLESSFPIIGITGAGEFLIKDFVTNAKKTPLYNFREVKEEGIDIIYDSDFTLNNNSGFNNAWMGYGREKTTYNLETGAFDSILEKPEPVLSLAKEISRAEAVEKKFGGLGIQNDNVHENYWRARQKNLTSLVTYSNTKLTLSFRNDYKPVRILDLVYFEKSNSQSPGESNEYISGNYLVTKVSRTITQREVTTLVEMCREGLN